MKWGIKILAGMGLFLVRLLPVKAVCRIGRIAGFLVYLLDRRHRRMAIKNLTNCFGDRMSAGEIRALCRENFKRIGESFLSAAKLASLPWEEVKKHVSFYGLDRLTVRDERGQLGMHGKFVFAIGHFGNFELFAWFQKVVPDVQCVATYRGLNHPGLSELMQMLRSRTGCIFVERRGGWERLKTLLNAHQNIVLGLLADQHAGKRGVAVPFFGRLASTSVAPAVIARRYKCRLFTAFCFREELGKWRIECGKEIPILADGRARPLREILADMNKAFEEAILRDPANWFWVHNRWKSPGKLV